MCLYIVMLLSTLHLFMQGVAGNTNHSAVQNVTRAPVIITNLVPGLLYEFKVVTPSISMMITSRPLFI